MFVAAVVEVAGRGRMPNVRGLGGPMYRDVGVASMSRLLCCPSFLFFSFLALIIRT